MNKECTEKQEDATQTFGRMHYSIARRLYSDHGCRRRGEYSDRIYSNLTLKHLGRFSYYILTYKLAPGLHRALGWGKSIHTRIR